jgi:hypothetical protein
MGRYTITTEGAEALGAATLETLLQVRGTTTQKIAVVGYGLSCDGTSATAVPGIVRVLRQTTDGTATGATEVRKDPDLPAAAFTGFHSFSAEPTPGEVLHTHHVHPQTGLELPNVWLPGDGIILDDATSSRVAIDATFAAAVNVVAWMEIVQ